MPSKMIGAVKSLALPLLRGAGWSEDQKDATKNCVAVDANQMLIAST